MQGKPYGLKLNPGFSLEDVPFRAFIHSQAVTGYVRYRADLLPCRSLSIAGLLWLLTHGQPFPTSSFPAAASPCTPELIIKQKIWSKTRHLRLLPMFCCKWGSLFIVCVSRNICSSSSSWWLTLGTVRVQLPLSWNGSKYVTMLKAFSCCKGNPNQAVMARQQLHYTKTIILSRLVPGS